MYHNFTRILYDERISERNNSRVDIISYRGQEKFFIEAKCYRNKNSSQTIINNALGQITKYKSFVSDAKEQGSFIFVMTCEIDDEIHKKALEQNIVIWDINNLIYLCEDNKYLLDLLIRNIPYSLIGVESEKPLSVYDEKHNILTENRAESRTLTYQEQLNKCKFGKEDGADKQYEKICTEIITYLFGSEFLRMSEQHKTNDDMFRMDLLCSLKGTTAFWDFLMKFYNTKFVVFEYKNYSKTIEQNLIYITEKYLFPVALRNVAFIISRKGFDENANKAAIGCLRENGKLIIDLTDDDLINMINMKESGSEPSDYLLDKVELLLISVSK